MRAGLRVAAADQVINFLRWLGPIDLGVFVAARRVVICFGLVLDEARWVAFIDQVDGFADRFDSQRENFFEVERTGGIVRIDFYFSLQQDRTCIDASIDPKKAQPCDGFAVAYGQVSSGFQSTSIPAGLWLQTQKCWM